MTGSHTEYILQTSIRRIQDLESRLASVEQLLNQQKLLEDSLGSVMAELRRLEHLDY